MGGLKRRIAESAGRPRVNCTAHLNLKEKMMTDEEMNRIAQQQQTPLDDLLMRNALGQRNVGKLIIRDKRKEPRLIDKIFKFLRK